MNKAGALPIETQIEAFGSFTSAHNLCPEFANPTTRVTKTYHRVFFLHAGARFIEIISFRHPWPQPKPHLAHLQMTQKRKWKNSYCPDLRCSCTKWCASSSRIKFLTHQSSQSLGLSFLSISANHGWKIGQDASASKNRQVSRLRHCCASSSPRTCAWSPHVAGVQPLKHICHLQNSTEQRCKKCQNAFAMIRCLHMYMCIQVYTYYIFPFLKS